MMRHITLMPRHAICYAYAYVATLAPCHARRLYYTLLRHALRCCYRFRDDAADICR